MSKGINDPFTAINCIHRLASILLNIASDGLPGGLIHDQNGKLRIATVPYTYRGLIDAAFYQIRQNAREIESVSIEMMKTIVRLTHKEVPREFHQALEKHALLLMNDCSEHFQNEHDLKELECSYKERCILQS